MNQQDREFFRQYGYVSIGKILTDEEVAHYTEQYDHDRETYGYFWSGYNHHQSINCDSLVSWPEVDELIRHPKVIQPIEELMGGPVCFSEVCVRHMARYEGEVRHSWHRDRPHDTTHPLRMPYIQLMLYLTDVDEGSHCFSISPESPDEPILETEAQLKRSPGVDLHGAAGTAILFNIAVLHTATVRPTERERKTVQVYYGPLDGPFLSNDSCIPTSFWRDHPDAATRQFYGKLNPRSKAFATAFGVTLPEPPA